MLVPLTRVGLSHRCAERNLVRPGGRCNRSCKSLSSESGFHQGCCVRVSLCVIAFFCVRVCFRLSVDTSDRVQLSCRRCGKLRSFLSSAIAPNTFLRQAPLTVVVSSSAWWLQMRRYLVRIPHRKGHSNHRAVRSARAGLQSPHLRMHSSWPNREGSRSAVANRIEQRWLKFGFGSVSLLVSSFLEFIEASSSFIRRGSPPGEANGPDG